MRVPFWVSNITPEDQEAVQRSLNSGYLTRGPEVEAFEGELCAISGARYAVCVSSGTAALMLAGSLCFWPESYISDATFGGVARAFQWSGTRGRWLDWPEGTTYEPEAYVDSPPMVTTTLHGRAWEHWPLPGMLDAAHGPLVLPAQIGMAVSSFDYQKHVRAGEGGAVLCSHKSIATALRLARDNKGSDGFNARMPEMCAALGRSQLKRYPENVARRLQLARRYHAALPDLCPPWQDGDAPLYYAIWHDEAPSIRRHLAKHGIETRVHYPSISGLPNATRNAERTLSLPLYPELTEDQVDYVIETTLGAIREC